jgi:hypothetical protein
MILKIDVNTFSEIKGACQAENDIYYQVSAELDNHPRGCGLLILIALETVETLPQGAKSAGVEHEHRDIVVFGGGHRLLFGVMGNFVGENHHGIHMSDAGSHPGFHLAENRQFDAELPGFLQIMLLQPVHPANHRYTHEQLL